MKPEERLTIEGVLAHPWLNCTEALDNVLPSAQMMMDKVSRKLIDACGRLKKTKRKWPHTKHCLEQKNRLNNRLCVGIPARFQAVVAGIQQAHAEQLANMRIQDLNVSLKPLNSVNNPILRKRKLLG